MRSLKSRSTARILLCAMLLAAAAGIVSCGKDNDVDNDNTSAPSDGTSDSTSAPEESGELTDKVPKLDFGGAEFTTITQTSTVLDIYVAESTGDVLSDAIYDRNKSIEERFNVKIAETNAQSPSDLSKMVVQSVQAGDSEWDLVIGQMENSGLDAQSGIFYNWYDIPYVDFDNPWYPKSIKEAGSVNGKMYIAMSDMCISYAQQTRAMVYDKVETEKRGINNIYDLVKSGKWTLDALNSIVKDIYEDVNNNGVKDAEDYYGFGSEYAGFELLSYFYGFDQRLASIDGNKVEMLLNCEKASNICDRIYRLMQEPYSLNTNSVGIRNRQLFNEGHLMMVPLRIDECYSFLRDYKNDYGIIPFPKWDENQDEYNSVSDAGCSILAVPITAGDIKMTGAVVEALSAESYKSVMPTYCNVALRLKSTRDDESMEMLQIVLDNRRVDFASLYDGWGGWIFKLKDFIASEGVFASTYESYRESVQAYYEGVLDFFYDKK